MPNIASSLGSAAGGAIGSSYGGVAGGILGKLFGGIVGETVGNAVNSLGRGLFTSQEDRDRAKWTPLIKEHITRVYPDLSISTNDDIKEIALSFVAEQMGPSLADLTLSSSQVNTKRTDLESLKRFLNHSIKDACTKISETSLTPGYISDDQRSYLDFLNENKNMILSVLDDTTRSLHLNAQINTLLDINQDRQDDSLVKHATNQFIIKMKELHQNGDMDIPNALIAGQATIDLQTNQITVNAYQTIAESLPDATNNNLIKGLMMAIIVASIIAISLTIGFFGFIPSMIVAVACGIPCGIIVGISNSIGAPKSGFFDKPNARPEMLDIAVSVRNEA